MSPLHFRQNLTQQGLTYEKILKYRKQQILIFCMTIPNEKQSVLKDFTFSIRQEAGRYVSAAGIRSFNQLKTKGIFAGSFNILFYTG